MKIKNISLKYEEVARRPLKKRNKGLLKTYYAALRISKCFHLPLISFFSCILQIGDKRAANLMHYAVAPLREEMEIEWLSLGGKGVK